MATTGTPSVLQPLPLPPTTDIRTAAQQLLSWAYSNGLLSADSFQPDASIPHPNFGQAVLEPGVYQALRTRQIRFLGINSVENVITVFLRRATPSVKEQKILPKVCNGYILQYVQGNPENVSPSNVATNTNSCATHQNATGSVFYTCGSSISVGNNREAGTLGCLVRDANGAIFGLSNNHVAGGCGYAPVGLPVLAPGIADVTPFNPSPFTLGLHTTPLPMVFGDPSTVNFASNSDAAIFRITATGAISSMQRAAYDTPISVMDLAPGMQVEKVGRTTGHTYGTVTTEIFGAIPVEYQASQYGFSGPAYFEQMFVVHGHGDVFSDSGDSGSLVTTLDGAGQRHAVGLVVAGCIDNSAPGGKRSLILPLRPILNSFNVTLVANFNC